MLLRKSSGKTFCAVAALLIAGGSTAACGKGESGDGAAPQAEKTTTHEHAPAQESTTAQGEGSEKEAKVTYEVTSTVDKPFKVTFIEKTAADDVSDLVHSAATETATATWTKEVTLSKGTDYALIVVTPDVTNFDSSAKYSCKITSDGKTVDEKKDQRGVVGCAGLKLQDQVKKEGS